MICSELTTFAVESPTHVPGEWMLTGCDLLRINYLCGRITNCLLLILLPQMVVICSELTTFAVESPTSTIVSLEQTCCDLLRINYLCGRITNCCQFTLARGMVVICSELTTFAVESPTDEKAVCVWLGCDLLRINYLCGRITNQARGLPFSENVVICSELTTFAVESPTQGAFQPTTLWLWFAQN